MKLKNGTDEEQTIIVVIWGSLKDLKEDYGTDGLLAARKYAMTGGGPKNAKLLREYGLITSRGMSQSAKNVILSAVTARGELVNPVAA